MLKNRLGVHSVADHVPGMMHPTSERSVIFLSHYSRVRFCYLSVKYDVIVRIEALSTLTSYIRIHVVRNDLKSTLQSYVQK